MADSPICHRKAKTFPSLETARLLMTSSHSCTQNLGLLGKHLPGPLHTCEGVRSAAAPRRTSAAHVLRCFLGTGLRFAVWGSVFNLALSVGRPVATC